MLDGFMPPRAAHQKSGVSLRVLCPGNGQGIQVCRMRFLFGVSRAGCGVFVTCTPLPQGGIAGRLWGKGLSPGPFPGAGEGSYGCQAVRLAPLRGREAWERMREEPLRGTHKV
jgi:hypothetical protein